MAEEAVDGEVHALPVLDSVYDKEKDLEGEVHALPVYDKEKDLEGEVHALPIKDGEVQPQLKICGNYCGPSMYSFLDSCRLVANSNASLGFSRFVNYNSPLLLTSRYLFSPPYFLFLLSTDN